MIWEKQCRRSLRLRQTANARIPTGLARGAVIGLVAVCTGCASAPKMNAAAPIEKHSAFLGTEYQQNGEAIDRQDMMSKLEQEPAAKDELSGHDALSTTSVVLATAGGFLVGWPIGQAIAGKSDPLWALAGVGGGLIALSIPLAIIADNKVEAAVDAHNRSVGAGGIQFRQSTPDWTHFAASPGVCRIERVTAGGL